MAHWAEHGEGPLGTWQLTHRDHVAALGRQALRPVDLGPGSWCHPRAGLCLLVCQEKPGAGIPLLLPACPWLPRLPTLVRSASGLHPRTSWSCLTPAPPTCGCPPSTARAWPAVSAGLAREGRGKAGHWHLRDAGREGCSLLQRTRDLCRVQASTCQREEAGPALGRTLPCPWSGGTPYSLPHLTPPGHPSSLLLAQGLLVPSWRQLPLQASHSTLPFTEFSLSVSQGLDRAMLDLVPVPESFWETEDQHFLAALVLAKALWQISLVHGDPPGAHPCHSTSSMPNSWVDGAGFLSGPHTPLTG